MSITPEKLTFVFFVIIFTGVLWMPATWLLLSIFTPKTLLEKYFKEPHFTLTETYMMREFPGFLIRTGMFGWLLVFPSLDKKRNIKNIKDYIPWWYAFALRFYIIGVIISLIFGGGLMGFLLLLPERYGPEAVLFTIPWF